ncbi:MAG: iron-containing alcohol dehydrogenase [SAR202 cluster bacterium]|nr:iron-containing alcohol dehydrogenase [Dehalococcoidia bacterium]MQF91345.1 iron-containing alcohol dehydrogenase [SAR202 cluster bacterium]MQG61784.1 iron-containing alcohol dehydrogenase [SAR202 cluster bacterium]MQG64295.1 iron-containing alcohol dehydrogenase [SAR202 cluster bacterium]|tara:strand:- start:698 stop:1903 length:1206 start_codon:yes stop_codon:yes gene_type:complete
MTQQNILQGDFNPTVPSRIVFGNEKIDSLRDEVKKLGGKRVLVLSGRTVAEKTDSVRRINEGLGDLSAGVYSGLIQRAPLSTAIEAANMAVANGVDTLVGLGGSTISDAARMIAVLMAEGITTVDQLRQLGEDQDMVLEPNLDGKSLPLQVSIPTTLSAGEFNMGGGNVLDDQAGHKIRVRHPRLYADLIMLDPVMTEGTPDWLWLSTGVKALDHCIERLYSTGNQPAIDAPVLAAAEMLFTYLPKSRESDGDPEARLQCLVAAWMSMMGAPNFSMGLSHAIGHIIGVHYSVGHGYTSCVTQPYVMEFNRPVSAAKQALLARSAGLDTRGMSDEAAAEAAARAVDDFIMGMGMPHRLRELEIPEEDLPKIAELVLTDGGTRSNPIYITSAEQVMGVLTAAF